MPQKSSRGSNKSGSPPSPDALIATLAGRQHGVITTAQLVQAGLGRPAIANRVRTGRLHRRYRGVYAVGHARLSQEGEWMAAILACGRGAYLASLSAAVLFKTWRRRVTGVHVLAPRERKLPGVHVHTYRRLDPLDVTHRHGIPVTTVPRTLVDLADVLTPHQLANVIHEAAFRKRFSEPATRAAIARANGRRNLDVLERALQLNAAGSAGTKSDLEDRFLALTARSGLPEPLVNTEVHGIEVDLHWPTLHLCVEVDGPGHTRPRTRTEDAARDAKLRAAGHTVLRFADHESAAVVARLRERARRAA